MTTTHDSTDITELNLVVASSDLTQFARYARGRSSREIFELMANYFEMVGDIVSAGGGEVIKFMGDAALMTFPEDGVDAGLAALRRLKEEGDDWCESRGMPCRHVIRAHFGDVVRGSIGTRDTKRVDIFGETVNTAFLVKSSGLAVTPQLFRKLGKEARTFLKKHTPPVRYIGAQERHQD